MMSFLAQLDPTSIATGGGAILLPLIKLLKTLYWDPVVEELEASRRRCAELEHELWRERTRQRSAAVTKSTVVREPPLANAAKIIGETHARLAEIDGGLGGPGIQETVAALRLLLQRFDKHFTDRAAPVDTEQLGALLAEVQTLLTKLRDDLAKP